MDTSGESVVSIVGHLVVLAMFVNVGLRMLPAERPFPWPALVFVVLIGVPSILQTWMTPVTGALARDPHATLAQGQWWRILTALGAQDGGLLAAVFNLVVIALALTFGTWIWGPWLAVALYLVPSIVLNLLAVLLWQAPGGGSSFANDGLMFSVFTLGLLVGTADASHGTAGTSAPSRAAASTASVRICAAIAVAVAVVLVAFDDAHGVAMLLGLVLGAGAWLAFRRRPVTSRSAEG